MRCRECDARVAAAARVCSRCGAPIVGQPPVLADTAVGAVSDTAVSDVPGKAAAAGVVGAVSDTAVSDVAGKAAAAGVVGQAPPEPYVPGSGDKLPAQLRLVLAGYVGVACGLFVGALACAAAVFLALFTDYVFDFVDYVDPDDGVVAGVIWAVITFGTLPACIWGLWRALKTLKAGSRFSRLLRRPNDARMATVMASERGGRTLILDSNPRDGTGRGYQPLSEVRLALWLKAGMLIPGETVTVYAGTGGKSEMLINSAQRGRGFLGTVKSRSTVHPGLGPLDEKVSGATLADWAAWAALTSFSSTGLRLGYNKPEVDAFREAIRDTFLGVSEPAVRADDVRGEQFPTHRPGYDKTQVASFLEAAGLRLAAMESTDRPAEPIVSDARLVGWAEWADATTFSRRTWRDGYEAKEVDAFREAIRDTFLGVGQPPVRAGDVRGKQFSSTDEVSHDGYDPKQVEAFLDAAGIRLAAMESTDRPAEPLVTGSILIDGPSGPPQQDFQPPRWAEWAAWAEWADSARFSTPRKSGYEPAEVDAFRQEIRDTFLGVRQPPLTLDEVRNTRFRMARRGGYDVLQVDAFVDEAEQRRAAMESHAAASRSTVAVEAERIKITIVYESMFGNSRKVAEAISDGVREARPEAQVACVAVRGASLELIRSTDLLIVGGPTHLGHMTTDFSRKRHISREEKAEAKGGHPYELEPETAGLGLREWFHQLPKAQVGGVLAGPHRHAAAFDTRLGSALAGGAAYGIGRKLRRRGYGLVKNPEGFILDDASGPPCAGEIERATQWGAQLVRASVAKKEGWAIWDDS